MSGRIATKEEAVNEHATFRKYWDQVSIKRGGNKSGELLLAIPTKRRGMSFNSSSFGPAPRAREDSIFRVLVLVHEGRPGSYYKSSTDTVVMRAQKRMIPTVSARLRPYSTMGVSTDVDDEKDVFAYHWEFFNIWFRCKSRCD
jgi:hypothetical protein